PPDELLGVSICNTRTGCLAEAMTRAGSASFCALVVAVLVAACGKQAALGDRAPAPGVYHLEARDSATALALRADGTFTVHRDAWTSAAVLAAGAGTAPSVAAVGAAAARAGLDWPTPPASPSTVFRTITLHGDERGDLVVVGESRWAGSFAQRWKPGRL